MLKFCCYFQMCLRQKLHKESGSKPVLTLFISLGINLNTDILSWWGILEKSFYMPLSQKNFTPNQQEGVWG